MVVVNCTTVFSNGAMISFILLVMVSLSVQYRPECPPNKRPECKNRVQEGPGYHACLHVFWDKLAVKSGTYPCPEWRYSWGWMYVRLPHAVVPIWGKTWKFYDCTRYRKEYHAIDAYRLQAGTHALYMDMANEDNSWHMVTEKGPIHYRLRIDTDTSGRHRWIDGSYTLTQRANPKKAWMFQMGNKPINGKSFHVLMVKGYGWRNPQTEKVVPKFRLDTSTLYFTVYDVKDYQNRYMYMHKLYWFELKEGGTAGARELKEIEHFPNCTVREVIEEHLINDNKENFCDLLRKCNTNYAKLTMKKMEDVLHKCCEKELQRDVRQFNVIVKLFDGAFKANYPKLVTTTIPLPSTTPHTTTTTRHTAANGKVITPAPTPTPTTEATTMNAEEQVARIQDQPCKPNMAFNVKPFVDNQLLLTVFVFLAYYSLYL